MLDCSVYRTAARKLSSGKIRLNRLFNFVKNLPDFKQVERLHLAIKMEGERNAEIFFLRTLYRFHLRRRNIRSRYLSLILSELSLNRISERSLVIYYADLIDCGNFQKAFNLLTKSVLKWKGRWRLSALFQLVRLGVKSSSRARLCVGGAKELRRLLEEEFDARVHQDRISKYILCSLFISSFYLRKMQGRTSPFVREICKQMDEQLETLLSTEEYWNAC